jgi:cytochrome c oxidase subunit 2
MLMNILLAAIIILTILTAVRLLKVFEFTSILRGRKPYEISESENNITALMFLLSMVGLFSMFIYFTNKYYNYQYLLPPAASVHGKDVDSLLKLNLIIITIAFIITQTLLLWFAYRYRYNKNRKAFHYAHNNTLEMVWTIIPAIVMALLVLKGLIVWNKTTRKSEDPDKIVFELYARQFDWTVRFAGKDKLLGEANYTMISGTNTLGLITPELIDEQLEALNKEKARLETEINEKFPNKEKLAELQTAYRRLKRQLQMVIEFKQKSADHSYRSAYDDIVFQDTIFLPVNKTIELHLRSQDVIHSAYLPHFRVHMYCVPGVKTGFTFTPTITTAEMRAKLGNPNFNYLLYCNNICGSAHYNMQLPIVIVTEEDFTKWLNNKKTIGEQIAEKQTSASASALTEEVFTESYQQTAMH